MQEVACTQEQALGAGDLREIVERASTIPERLGGGIRAGEWCTGDAVVAACLDAWRQNVAKGDAE